MGDPFARDPLSHKPPTTDEVEEQLDTIHDELGCNAIVLIAGDGTEDNLIEGCKIGRAKSILRAYVLKLGTRTTPSTR